jgi:hypothetical protein
LVEIYNDSGSTQAMVYPTTTARRKETLMLFANADLGWNPLAVRCFTKRAAAKLQVFGVHSRIIIALGFCSLALVIALLGWIMSVLSAELPS